MNEKLLTPEFIFEVSWEICNKVGGINTVVATKALNLVSEFKDNFILVGPDLWRETQKNPVFLEDPNLFRTWRNSAQEEGLRIKVGRWKIVGNPIVILIDFSAFVPQKDQIFKTFWEKYGLDSISGQRDYVESAIFGYAAGKVIDSFCSYNLTIRDKVVAHFHEWMTGAGVLYLKQNAPQVATLFTTHATIVGRSIAGNGQELYSKLKEYNGDAKARELNVVAKQSLEKCSAQNADCFTTVSEITAKECEQFLEKKVDVVTPNGFEDNFVPQDAEFETKRKDARKRILEVAQAMFGEEISQDAVLIANSGRYEFRNKGIDIFIQSLGELQKRDNLKKDVIALILVPANNYGPRRDLMEKLQGKDIQVNQDKWNKYLTHGLHEREYDQILNECKNVNLENTAESRVKIIYAPCYLDGNDGIFNMGYYDILIGMDLTIFPSYYEPWGYTPLESLAFHIPTVTTNLAGIGMWVNRELVQVNDGIDVLERKVGKDETLIKNIVERIVAWTHKSDYDQQRARENAFTISRIALWKNLIRYYKEAFHIALEKIPLRADKLRSTIQTEHFITKKEYKSNKPVWKSVMVQSKLPDLFKGLDEISRNLWWCWNYEAIELFEYVDKDLWASTLGNPIVLIKETSLERFTDLQNDQQFIYQFNQVYSKFKKYMAEKDKRIAPRIAYFSMEFGLSDTLKIFSGGLGILAGDYLKEASDVNIDMFGIGFLYKYGYFTQQLSLTGEQLVTYEAQNYSNLPINPVLDEAGNQIDVQVAFPGRTVYARIWRVDVGRTPLYLLETDFEKNTPEDRKISWELYGGDNEHRLKQEMFLGIGGIRAIEAVGLKPDLYHCNEGHAAFIGIERLRYLINDMNLTFMESLEIVRASTLYTTHTPVPAGHDSFSEDLIMIYMGHYPSRLKITWDEFINLGKVNPEDKTEKFSMSVLATNVSQEVNGVSWLHGEVTKAMFNHMWEGFYPEELHIGYVTNGIHGPTWMAKAWKNLYRTALGEVIFTDMSNKEHWNKIYKVADKNIWEIRQNQRKILIDFVKDRISRMWVKRHEDPKRIVEIKNLLNENTLTFGFARRFATYKRAYLLFSNLERLAKIVNNHDMPVQFFFAGKAHPRDGAGQDLIKHIVQISRRPEFRGKIVFLENYDMELAKKLVQGVDVWLNTPTRPLEASGTSGMKAVINGVMNFSVLDGWWVEGYKEGAGWMLPEQNTYDTPAFQDELDAETIYATLEEQIIPLFYKRDQDGIPTGWIDYIKNCIANIAPEFTTKRMIDDYKSKYYHKLFERTLEMRKNDFQKAKTIATWKKKVFRSWDAIEVVSTNFSELSKETWRLGDKYLAEVVLDLKDLGDITLGVELVVTDNQHIHQNKIISIKEFELVKVENNRAHFQIEIVPPKAGMFNYGVRVYPKNADLPHRMDFSYLKWI